MKMSGHYVPEHIRNIAYPSYFTDGSSSMDIDTVHNILWFGLYHASTFVDYNMEQVIERTLRNYYTDVNGNSVSLFLHQLNLKILWKHDCYEDFEEDEIDYILGVFKLYPQLEADAIELYQVWTILMFYKIFGHAESIIKNGKELLSKYSEGDKLLLFNIDALLEFKNGSKNWDEDDNREFAFN